MNPGRASSIFNIFFSVNTYATMWFNITAKISIGNYMVREVLIKNARVFSEIPRVRSTSGISPNTRAFFINKKFTSV